MMSRERQREKTDALSYVHKFPTTFFVNHFGTW